jgi:nucleotide-binding universal stress UspA family protein
VEGKDVKQILVAIDFSEHTDSLLRHATELARATGAALTLLHVAAPDPAFVGLAAGPQSVRDARAHTLDLEHRELARMAEALQKDGIPGRALLRTGATVEKILDEAERLSADLIVVGSHGRGPLGTTFVGSVSRRLLHHAACPVLVVPARKRP